LIGVADSQTKLNVQFSGVPGGLRVFAPLHPSTGGATLLNPATGAPLTSGNALDGTFVEIPLVNGAGNAVWQVDAANPAQLDNLAFGVALQGGSQPPTQGQLDTVRQQVIATLEPASTQTLAATGPIPRFLDEHAPRTVVNLQLTARYVSAASSSRLSAKAVSVSAASNGTLSYVATNNSDTNATNVVVRGNAPAGVVFGSCSTTGGSCTSNPGGFTATIPNVGSGQSQTINVQANVADAQASDTNFTPEAKAWISGNQEDSELGDNQASVVIQRRGPFCAMSVVPSTMSPDALLHFLDVSVNLSPASCQWTGVGDASWLRLFQSSSNDLQVTVFPNVTPKTRVGHVTITASDPAIGAASEITADVTINQGASALDDSSRFITLMYLSFLGRNPSQPEINNWLTSGRSRADMANDFWNSAEFGFGGRFVATLYVALLGRDAEFNGWQFQRFAVSNNAFTQVQLADNFLNSAEYKGQHPNQSDADFVNFLFSSILGRSPSPDEMAFRLNQLKTTSRAQVASDLLVAPEFRARINGQLDAFLVYATLLLRDGSPAERQARMDALNKGQTTTSKILTEIINSPEFQLVFQ